MNLLIPKAVFPLPSLLISICPVKNFHVYTSSSVIVILNIPTLTHLISVPELSMGLCNLIFKTWFDPLRAEFVICLRIAISALFSRSHCFYC